MRSAVEFVGFDTGTRFSNEIDGVHVAVIHPRFVDSRWIGDGIFNDDQIRHGYQVTYKWTEPFGSVRKDRHVIKIVDFQLSVDGRDYGIVSQGDTVIIDRSSVKVVKSSRLPKK